MIYYSFIIPHHNCPGLLERLIASIPEREDIEIIVVDDNSADDKKPTVERPDVKIIYIEAKDSQGAGHARNIGMENASGKWLLFADSDDYYEKGFLNYLDNYKDTDNDIVFFSAHVKYDLNSPKLSEPANYIEEVFTRYEQSQHSENDFRRMTMTVSVPWNKMFNRAFVSSIGCEFESVPVGNDAWFCKYAGSKAKKAAIIHERLYYYISYPNNTTNRKRPVADYYSIIDSNIRRNKLYKEYGLLDIGIFPGFYTNNVQRDFSSFVCLKLVIYAMLHDPTLPIMCFVKVKSRIERHMERR